MKKWSKMIERHVPPTAGMGVVEVILITVVNLTPQNRVWIA